MIPIVRISQASKMMSKYTEKTLVVICVTKFNKINNLAVLKKLLWY